MTLPPEPRAMSEIREIRDELSRILKDMTPEDRVIYLRKEAEALEKQFGLDLRHIEVSDEKTA